jgi:ABC-2 type transport system permease protein
VNRRAIRALVAKDLTVVRRSRALMVPMILVPVLLAVLLPAAAGLMPALAAGSSDGAQELRRAFGDLPAALRDVIAGYTLEQGLVVAMLVYLLAPLFLLVPFMVSNVIAADSFAGERDRKTLEALLYTPMTDAELFAAKVIAAWVPAMVAALAGFVVYSVVANVAAWPVMGRVFFPPPMWFVLVLWVAPAVAALGLGVTVLVSMRVRGVHEAIQLSGVLVLPVVALVVGQVRGVMLLGVGLLAVLGAALWILSAAVLWLGARSFERQKVVARI